MRRDQFAGFTTVDHLMTPQNNLALQTKGAQPCPAFVGTYGGPVVPARSTAVTSCAFYSIASGSRGST